MRPGRFIFCPSLGQQNRDAGPESNLINAVGRLLKARKWRPANKVGNAGLLVMVPKYTDRLTVEDARWMGQRCGGGAPVLIVDVHGTFVAPAESILPWLHVARPLANPDAWAEQLCRWLNDSSALKSVTYFTSIDEVLRSFPPSIMRVPAGDTGGINAAWKKVVDETAATNHIGNKTTPALLKSDWLLDFYYGLVRMNAKYARIEHNLNRAIQMQGATSQAEELTLARLGELSRARKFVDGCSDLLESLRHTIPKPADPDRKVILLIDDRPDLIEQELREILARFLHGYELWIWNPSRSLNLTGLKLGLLTLADYASLRFQQDLGKRKIDIKAGTSEFQIGFGELLEKSAFVLVDILFDMPDGSENEIGTAAIRGIIRLMQDLSTRPDGSQLKTPMPEILAISRADHQQKIQATLLSGASGYLLKGRLLAMPAMLGRLHTPVIEPSDAGHRNFRSLYALPRETIALLKIAKINPIDFRRGFPGTTSVKFVATGRLLQALPKTDLHVHVGSLMSAEYLAVASIVMLLRHEAEGANGSGIIALIRRLTAFFWGASDKKTGKKIALYLRSQFSFPDSGHRLRLKFAFNNDKAVKAFADEVRNFLVEQIEFYQAGKNGKWHGRAIKFDETTKKNFYLFRSLLHRTLDIRDHISPDAVIRKIKSIPDLVILQFALAHAETSESEPLFSDPDSGKADVIRIFVLHLATRQELGVKFQKKQTAGIDMDCSRWFANPALPADPARALDSTRWNDLRKQFYNDKDLGDFSYEQMRKRDWSVDPDRTIAVAVTGSSSPTDTGPLTPSPDFGAAPLSWMLASGTRSSNLEEYLEGCELSGAEHLQHPFLMHLYAQHVVHQLAEHGVLYAELRAAAAGYEAAKYNFTFSEALRCLMQSFHAAQHMHWNSVSADRDQTGAQTAGGKSKEASWLWSGPFELPHLSGSEGRRRPHPFPVKVGIVLVGKRHKPTREMFREAAGAVVLHTRPPEDIVSARDFVTTQLPDCRLVGFDLAGKEEGFPPERFRAEFEPLARLHIPITAHAGENAKSDYIESAVLDLRARRLGHGLALPEDPQLLGRVREDNVCIELCPVSNFQTSCFVPYGSPGHEREYPLRRFIENGNAVCLNTDNPIISDTNIIKEYFQASYGYDKEGLPLWEALRLMRMGFVQSFMSFPERRAMLEIADQILFDYFSREDVVLLLRELARSP